MAEIVHVPLSGERAYDIHIGAGLLASVGEIVKNVARSNRVVIVSQPPIAKYYEQPVADSLKNAGFAVDTVQFPAGERYKNLRTLEKLYGALYELKPAIDRKTTLIALGGGVVGDVVGFLAATYLRGLDYVQIPTTLLAMVDSSVGGKTGIDYRAGKNLVGAFHQPRAVIADTETLATLPKREMTAGLAEIIKYGVISDPEILQRGIFKPYGLISRHILRHDDADVPFLVRRSCEIKAEVVTQDEYEMTGMRAILNFGHTIGHAVESATHYRRYKHGEAVAIGMIAAACIGDVIGITPEGVRERLYIACEYARLPLALPTDVSDDDLIALLGRDKKSENGVAKFVLARAIGDVVTGVVVEESAIRKGLTKQRSQYSSTRGNMS